MVGIIKPKQQEEQQASSSSGQQVEQQASSSTDALANARSLLKQLRNPPANEAADAAFRRMLQ